MHGKPTLISHDPCARSLPKAERRIETRPATPEQIKGVYYAISERHWMSVYLAVFGRGLHGRGVCALLCRDIDLNTRTLRIRRYRSTEDPR
ncbi:hypothetical protein [Bifidobacterium psychraerophilum]|uniref:hypothetical protein n=1 Tax=Bifidobacterium psychraerophilum TaxID=218140 RepID=UPI0023F4AB5F|nr:hypothetical protein [Bifidobacterium psychraerophilum]MCI1660273.1 hypothetical protein [Bifidobacterium psychraerophilum]MCI1803944.1 hypothetical protein [Bifidobacterium psychraerophilum]MCI2175758.1 hypothetical protein [Bifidobacterium psychraerophilum]MCI2181764.1 hypothetical protein [Bifidobacterium psychraerophilum]